MHGKVVLVCTDRTRTWRQVTPPLAGAGNQLVHAESTERASSLLATGVVDLVVVEWPSGIDLGPVTEAAGDRVPLVVLVSETGIRSLEELVCRRGMFHICAARPDQEGSATRVIDPAELVVTCEKILRRDLFGLDKYLAGFGIERPVRVVKHASDRDGLVAELGEAVRALGAGRRVVESVSLVGDELITNAVYNAPRCADGTARYAHVSRREKVALEPSEHVEVTFGSDGRTFGLSVTDRFGALVPESLRRGIERCVSQADPIEHKPGGAGIGLYAALCHADQLVFNLHAGSRTEVIALWGMARKSGGRGAGVASLHVFQAGLPSADDEEDAPSSGVVSVHLSDSVKSEVLTAFAGEGGARGGGRIRLSERAAREARVAREAAEAAAAEAGGSPAATRLPEVDPDLDTSVTEIPSGPDADERAAAGGAGRGAGAEPGDRTDTEILLDVGTGEVLAAADDLDETEDFLREPPSPPPLPPESRRPRRLAQTIAGPLALTERRDLELAAPELLDGEPTLKRVVEPVPGQDLADLYEMASVMEATGLLDQPTPPWVGPLTCLRGVQIPRGAVAATLDGAITSLRAATTLADAIESLLGYLVVDWSAAMLLCRLGDTLMPWTAAGDVDTWEELCEIESPLSPGWLSARTRSPGVTLAALDDDPSARRLGDMLTLPRVEQGLAISFVLDQAVLVVFACRPRSAATEQELSAYEDLQRELAELTARVDRSARPTTGRRQTIRAGAW